MNDHAAAAAGFKRVFESVRLDRAKYNELLDWYVEGAPHGNVRDDQRICERLLTSVEWAWPWFDEWRDRFAAIGEWPHMWIKYAKLEASPPQWPLEYVRTQRERERIALLVDTLWRAAAQARDLDSGREAIKLLGPGKFHWYLHTGEGVFHDRFVPRIAERIAVGDLSKLPPYFPGDRSIVQFG